ncbi:hypothetical protein D9M68_19820 [compost metagenome]
MKKLDFYIAALKAKAYHRKDWVIGAFAVVRTPARATGLTGMQSVIESIPVEGDALYSIRYNRDSTEVYVPTLEGDSWVSVTDAVPMTPLFYASDDLVVTPDMIPNCSEKVESTYGDLLFNWMVLVEPFDTRIGYQVGPVSISKIERMIAKKLVDDESVAGRVPAPDEIPVSMYMRFGRCMGAMAGFVQVFVPTLTPKSLTTDPEIRVRRTALLEENADRLQDPVVVSKIQNELILMDKAWIKDDPSEGFLLSNKTFATARKRMFTIHGPEAGFNEGGNAELVVNSLNEGWDLDKIVPMFNSTRAGSFYRGALTALGGEAVKFFMRVFQNVNISEDDCGSRLGVYRTIEKGQADYYTGLWELLPNGLQVISEERAKALEGKTVLTRSPLFCKTGSTDFCAKCVGEALAAIPNAISSENTSVASNFMSIMMASAHAKELNTAQLNFEEAFT